MGVRCILKNKHFALSVTCLIKAMKAAPSNFARARVASQMNNKLAKTHHR
jgi:hypothetical protein